MAYGSHIVPHAAAILPLHLTNSPELNADGAGTGIVSILTADMPLNTQIH